MTLISCLLDSINISPYELKGSEELDEESNSYSDYQG